MSNWWICCNSCYQPPGAELKLAVTNCGHVICVVCYKKGGKQEECLICNSKCLLSPLCDKSSSDVKALFSDINVVATKNFSEITKVLGFQARQQKRLLTHYQQRNEKLEEAAVKMKQDMQKQDMQTQEMAKKLNEQKAYISQLEKSMKHQSPALTQFSGRTPPSHRSHSGRTPPSHRSHSAHPVLGPNSAVRQIPYNSPMSRHGSMRSLADKTEVDGRSLFRKPQPTVSRLSLLSTPQDGRMGTIPHRAVSQNSLGNHSASSFRPSPFQRQPSNPAMSFGGSSAFTFGFKPSASFKQSMSSLVRPLP